MFTEKLRQYASKQYKKSLNQLGKKGEEIQTYMESLQGDEEILMKFLYGTMPFADASDYGPELFYAYVKHSLYLKENSSYTKHLPEEMFLNYVLYHRVNNEDIVNCRPWLYEKVKERIKGCSQEDAIKELNYWCAENVTYAASDERTLNPIAVYKSITARCGEESTFLVSVLRSVGIPARQVYTPRWAHCDDNHAWVEAWDGEKWRFLGACEPEEVLDKGWFTNASSRAMLIHTRVFSDYVGKESVKKNEITGRDGAVIFYNDTSVYAKTMVLTVRVEKEDGTKAVNCLVQFELMNMAEFYPISTQHTNEEGEVSVELGKGTIQIFCSLDDQMGSVLINTEDTKEVIIRLKNQRMFVEEEAKKEWQFFDLIAPFDYPMHPSQLTTEQKERGRVKKQKADQIRNEKKDNFYPKEKAKKYEGNEAITTILKNAYGNFDEIYDFLEKDPNPYRLLLLQTLEVKDTRDVKNEVLEEHLQESLLVKEVAFAYLEEMEEEQELLFVQYVMNPRIRYEMIRPYRKEISKWFTKEEKQQFLKNPSAIWDYVKQHVVTTEDRNYETVVTSPVGALMTGQGSELSKKTLFVAICRTLGIPARINPIHGNIEYWKERRFIKADGDSEKKEEMLMDVTFTYEGESVPAYFVNWTIGKLEKKKEWAVFETLDYTKTSFDIQKIKLQLPKGYYRLYTTMRIPSGNQMIAVKYFIITGEEKEKTSSFFIRQPRTEDMLEDLKLDSFSLKNEANEDVLWEQIAKNKVALLSFLEVGMEPTEHVLNELKEKVEEIKEKDFTIVFVLKDKRDMENQTLRSLLKELPQIQIYYDDFKELPEMIARRMYTDPEKLPLLVLTTESCHGRYACSGYNVGTVELLCNIRNIL